MLIESRNLWTIILKISIIFNGWILIGYLITIFVLFYKYYGTLMISISRQDEHYIEKHTLYLSI